MLSNLRLVLLLASFFLASIPAALPSSVGPSSGDSAHEPFDILLRNHSSIDKRGDPKDVGDDWEVIESDDDLVNSIQDDDFEVVDLPKCDDDPFFSPWDHGTTKSYSSRGEHLEIMSYKDHEGPKAIVRKTEPIAQGKQGKTFAGRLWRKNARTHKFESVRDVAVKLSTPAKKDGAKGPETHHTLMTLSAADRQMSVKSENVVEVLAAFYVDRADATVSAVTVMEYVSPTVDLQKDNVFWKKPVKDKLTYYKPLLMGVQSIHEADISHLSLVPKNILLADFLPSGKVDPKNKVKVKITGFLQSQSGQIANMNIMSGDTAFTPPEKEGKEKTCLAQPVDMWYLGMLLPYFLGIYELFSNEHAEFHELMSQKSRSRENAVEVMKNSKLEGLDKDLIELLSHVLCKAENRMTIHEFNAAYDKWLEKRGS